MGGLVRILVSIINHILTRPHGSKWRGASGRDRMSLVLFCLISFLFRLKRKKEGFPVWRALERFITVDDYESKHGTFPGLFDDAALRSPLLPCGYFPGLVVSNPVENPRYK
ncbi:hypothetical protein V8C43DRAFT_285488 [Trichoderma afarasin]